MGLQAEYPICLIFAPLKGYDEPEILPSQLSRLCLIGADAGHPTSDQRAAELPVWLHRYNWHRPHGSLKSKTPISRLALTEDNLLRLHS